MSRKEETFYPNEILDAIAYAKKQDPSDKFGDKAFQIELNPREGNNNTKWMTMRALKNVNGKMEFKNLKLKVTNLKTTANIKTEEEKKAMKGQDYPGINLTFQGLSTFTRQVRKASGEVVTVTEKYGEAKVAIAKAFGRIMKAAIDPSNPKRIYAKTPTIVLNVQLERLVDKNKGLKEKLDTAIIRVKLPFVVENGVIGKNALPAVDVFDAEVPRALVDGKKTHDIPFAFALDDAGKPFDYTSIRGFLRCGSATSFIEDISGVCISSQGISNPARVNGFLIVKRSRGNRLLAHEVYDEDEFASMSGAVTSAPTADGDDDDEEPTASTQAPTTSASTSHAIDDIEEEAPATTAASAADFDEEPEPEPEPPKKTTTKKPAAKKPVKKVDSDEELE